MLSVISLLPLIALVAGAAVSPKDLLEAVTQGKWSSRSVSESVLTVVVERIALLKDDSDFVFRFDDPSQPPETVGAGGSTRHAARDTFPALVGTGMAMTVGFLDPCSMNTPHTHPRATEFNMVMNGSLYAGFLAENGARFVANEVPTLSATVFPQGAIHFEANLGCEPAVFVAAFNNEDPGVLQIAQRFFGLPAPIVGATLGGLGVQEVAGLAKLVSSSLGTMVGYRYSFEQIPDNIALGVDACFKKCGIKKPKSQPTKQQQPPSPTSYPKGY
ncbi:RmlC-like cupin [Auricularia subglabra TFB-10046 SS5]|nr:RmlC-like cupin [Auricularia subglabra TFB-10046 SS5]